MNNTNLASKKRSSNFTPKEVKTLLALVKKYKTIIECKRIDSKSNELKNTTWEKITREFNSTLSDSRQYRTMQTLRLKYENAKKQSNRKFALLLQMSKNGTDRKSIRSLNITDIDKYIKRLTCKVPPATVKIEINSDNEEGDDNKEKKTCKLSDSKLLKQEIIEISDDSRLMINEVEVIPAISSADPIEHSPPIDQGMDISSAATTKLVANGIDSSPETSMFENKDVDTFVINKDLNDVELRCLLEEHNLKLKHLEEMHKFRLEHQQLQNNLSISQQEEIHKEKLRTMKEEHEMKMKILNAQRLSSF